VKLIWDYEGHISSFNKEKLEIKISKSLKTNEKLLVLAHELAHAFRNEKWDKIVENAKVDKNWEICAAIRMIEEIRAWEIALYRMKKHELTKTEKEFILDGINAHARLKILCRYETEKGRLIRNIAQNAYFRFVNKLEGERKKEASPVIFWKGGEKKDAVRHRGHQKDAKDAQRDG